MLEILTKIVAKYYVKSYYKSKEGINMTTKLSNRLKHLRKELKLSQEYVANVLGMHRTTITAIESGVRKITADELKNFSELYGVTTDELLYETKLN